MSKDSRLDGKLAEIMTIRAGCSYTGLYLTLLLLGQMNIYGLGSAGDIFLHAFLFKRRLEVVVVCGCAAVGSTWEHIQLKGPGCMMI